MTTLERLQMQSMNRLDPYFYASRNAAVLDAYEYTIPEVRDTVLGKKSAYEAVLDQARAMYVSTEDNPGEFGNRMMLGKIISNLMPNVTPAEAARYAEDYMYRATGYRTNVGSYTEHLTNTFRSAGSSLLASFELFSLYANGFINQFDEVWQERKKEKMSHIKSHAMNYRVDNEYNDNIFENAMTAAANLIPSMLPAIGISGIAAFISAASGGALAATFPGLIHAWGNMSAASRLINLASLGARFGTSAMMEGGAAMLDLAKAGADDDLIFKVGTTVGAINGTLENVVDFDLNLAAKPIRDIFSILGSKASGKFLRNAIHETANSLSKDIFKSIVSETPTEIMQEISSMIAFNFALDVQKDRGRPLADITGYTKDDFANAFMETMKQTALGTGLISLGGGVIGLGTSFTRSAFAGELTANRYTSSAGANADINVQDIKIPDRDISGITEESLGGERTAPIDVLRIGKRYIPIDPTDEQIFAMNNSEKVYGRVMEMTTENAIKGDISSTPHDRHSPMTIDTVNNALEAAFVNSALEGFTYYDENMKPISPADTPRFVSIKAIGIQNPVVVEISSSDSVSPAEFEGDVFGTTFEKVSDNPSSESPASENSATENTGITEEDYTIEDEASGEEADAAGLDIDEDEAGIAEAEFNEVLDTLSFRESSEDADVTEGGDETVLETAETEQTAETAAESVSEAESIVKEPAAAVETAEEPITSPAPVTQNPEAERIQSDTARRNAAIEARNAADNEWNDIKRQLTGDRGNDVDVIADHFRKLLKDTDMAKTEGAAEASARASAEVIVGFAKASGMVDTDYYDTVRGFLYNVNPPSEEVLFDRLKKRDTTVASELNDMVDNAEPIRVESPDIDYSLDRNGMQSAIRSWASEHSITSVPYINADTGISITAYRKAVDEIIRHGVGIDTDVRYKSVAFIPEIIKKGKYIGSAPNTNIRVDAEFFDYFIAPIEIDGTEYIVTAATAEMNNGEHYYDHRLIKKEDIIQNARMTSPAHDYSSSSTLDNTRLGWLIQRENNRNPILNSETESEYIGWFNPDSIDRYISIMENAEPTTLIHELGHHFLSVLSPENPAYSLIANVYAKQIAKDGGVIGTNTQEAFAKDLEKYVYLRKSSNKRLNGIFQTLYNVASSLWRTLKSTMRLSPEKVQMFDAIFYEEDSGSTVEADAKAESSTAPLTEIIETTLPAPETEPRPAEAVAGSIAEEAAEISTEVEEFNADNDIEADTEPAEKIIVDLDENPVAEAVQDTVAVPQTEEEIASGEPVKEYAVANLQEFLMPDGFFDQVEETDGKYLRDKAKTGKVDSKKITEQIKAIQNGRKPADILAEVNRNPVVRDTVIKMETRTSVYKYLSGLMDADIDADTMEFYYGDKGSIYVKLKKDIRYNPDTDKNELEAKRSPRWFRIPFDSDTSISVADAVSTWYQESLLSKDADMDTFQLNEDFKGYSDPETAAVAFAYAYETMGNAAMNNETIQGYPLTILHSTDYTTMRANLRSIARNTVPTLKPSAIYNTYGSFLKEVDEVSKRAEKEAEKDFASDEADRREGLDEAQLQELDATLESRKEWYIREAVAEAVGGDPEGSDSSLFGAYLERNMDKLGLENDVSGMSPDERSMFFEELADALIIGYKSYTSIAHAFRDGIANEKKFNSATRLLRYMVASVNDGASFSTVVKQISNMLAGTGASVAWNNIAKAFRNDQNRYTVSNDDIRAFLSTVVDSDGNVALITEDSGGHYISPLIILANYYYGRNNDSFTEKTNYSFQKAGNDYVQLSTRIMEDRQGLSHDMLEGNVSAAIMDLRDSIRKASEDKSLKPLFNRATSYDYITGLVDAVTSRVKALEAEKEASKGKVTPEIQKQIDSLTASKKELEKTVTALNKAAEKAGTDKAKLKEALSEMRKENADLTRQFDKLGGIETAEELTAELSKLRRQLDNRDKRIKQLETDGTARERKLQNQIKLMENLPAYKTAKEIRQQYDEHFGALRRYITDGNARVGATLGRIFNALSKRQGSAFNMNVFESAFEGYEGYFIELRDFITESGMVKDGKLVKNITHLSLDELSSIDDLMKAAYEDGIEKMEADNAARAAVWENRLNAVIKALPKLKLTTASKEEIQKAIDEIRMTATKPEEIGDFRKFSSRFKQLEVVLRNISPTLHDVIFGGIVEGQYVDTNVNTAQNQKDRMTSTRKEKIANKAHEIFNIDARDMDIAFDRLFTKDLKKLGSMTPEEFASKNGISWGTLSSTAKRISIKRNENLNPALAALEWKILMTQADVKKAQAAAKTENIDMSNYNTVMSRGNQSDFTMQEMMGIYLLARQKDGVMRLITDPNHPENTNHLSIGNVLWVMDQFMNNKDYAKYREFADYLSEVVGERYNDVAEVYFRQNNKILNRVMFYSPIRDAIPATVKELQEKGALTREGKIRANFVEERTGSAKAADLNAISSIIRTIEDQENYIAFQEIHDTLSAAFKPDSNLAVAFADVYGNEGRQLMSDLGEWNDRVAGAEPRLSNPHERLFSIVRKNLAVSVLWMAPSVLLQQIPTYSLAARFVGLGNAVNGLTEYFGNKKANDEFIYRLSPQMKQRARLEVANYRAAMNTHLFEGVHRWLMEHDNGNIYLKNRERYQKAIRWGMEVSQKLDTSLANAMWLTIYNYNMSNMKRADGMTDAQFQEYVANTTTQQVLSVQSSQNAKDNALAYSDQSEMLRTILMFTSQLNKQYNMIYEDTDRIRRQGFNKETFQALATTGLYIGIATLGAALISGKALPDEDDDEWWEIVLNALKGTAIESTSMVPLIGSSINDVLSGAVYYDTGVTGSIINLIRTWAKDKSERKDWQLARANINFFADVGNIIGFPVRPMTGGFNALTDEAGFNIGEFINSSWGDMARRFM